MIFIKQYHLEILVFIFLITGLVISIKQKLRENRSSQGNFTTFLLIDLFAAFIVVTISFISKVSDKKQIDRIERLDSLNHKLSIQIESLSRLNYDLGNSTKNIVDKNFQLTDSANEIISVVKDLTITNKEVTKLIHKESGRQIEENALSGQLNFKQKKKLLPNDLIYTKFGGYTNVNPARFYYPPNPVQAIDVAGVNPIKIDVVSNLMLLSMIAYDLDGNWIMEINNNNWRRNPNTTGKFNYDSSGFEIIDNRGLVVLNLNLISNNIIDIRGYLMVREKGVLIIGDDKGFKVIGLSNPEWFKVFFSEYGKRNIAQIFDYTGRDWIHRRLK